MEKEKEKIKEKVRKQLPLLKKKYHVKRIGIFGSFVRGDWRKGSDVDMLVEFESPIGLFAFVEMEDFLSRSLRKKVDLVAKKSIKPAVKKEILKEVTYV
ncbi:MAG: nucleotidyltransferase [Candidatus Moranbacteria bacterium RIFCSPHIGHO2_02_FULL_40_12b]|nr:MAG: nucleotidyltransferase [Candidatus Moranbacteria bacterium RIFCSPHIGHO2_02_FULL_40_12b]OGI23610.1 MAG: nucleotidyltransferase [Candidatus Moranbacteria bacterium RIFCSPHIGHO2_12_FULL_40_10]